jgi:hypothetical protein
MLILIFQKLLQCFNQWGLFFLLFFKYFLNKKLVEMKNFL